MHLLSQTTAYIGEQYSDIRQKWFTEAKIGWQPLLRRYLTTIQFYAMTGDHMFARI